MYHSWIYWNDIPGHRYVKLLLREPSHEIGADLFKLNEKQIN
jgi:hypothetical protein